MIIISLDGNIGAGKSTFLENMKPYFDYVFLSEPVDQWSGIRDSQNNTILEHFYMNKEKNSFAMQISALITRAELISNAVKEHPNKVIIMERSLETDEHVFASYLFSQGYMSEIEMATYKFCAAKYKNLYPVSGIIYLKTDTKTCLERINKRNRPGEKLIDESLIRGYEKMHEDYVEKMSLTIPTLELNSNDNSNVLSVHTFIDHIVDLQAEQLRDKFSN